MTSATSKTRTSHYLHAEQKNRIRLWQRQWLWRSELPTWCVLIAVYGGWALVVYHWQTLGKAVGTPLLILIACWYMSLQHELIHGHPTRWPRVNQLLGLLPLAVWYPYGIYRDAHLAHHNDDSLTHPLDDPESYYFPSHAGSIHRHCGAASLRFEIPFWSDFVGSCAGHWRTAQR